LHGTGVGAGAVGVDRRRWRQVAARRRGRYCRPWRRRARKVERRTGLTPRRNGVDRRRRLVRIRARTERPRRSGRTRVIAWIERIAMTTGRHIRIACGNRHGR